MSGLLTSGSDYFPGWVSILFSIGLALGIVHHLPCLIRGHGNRWFHTAHTAMALSMIYMYLSMSYDWNWLPATWQMWFFVTTAVAITGWLLTKALRRQTVNFLWILVLVQQAAMAYMWYPMMRWNAILIFVLVSWFAIETFGWAANLLPDDIRMVENHTWFPYEFGAPHPRVSTRTTRHPAAVAADRTTSTLAEETSLGTAPDCHTGIYLLASDWRDRTLMAIMALSMGYMFYGMQLLR